MWDRDLQIAQERYNTLRREAAESLRLKPAREQQASPPSFRSRMLDQHWGNG
ncbi:MAG: hypothetical protein MI924_14160 [Chloroflexales bacterium]|nr:hypothetical protein [Chloroflexales bacterium]